MAGINGNSSPFCMQGRERALSLWPLALSQTKTNSTNPVFSASPRLRGEIGGPA